MTTQTEYQELLRLRDDLNKAKKLEEKLERSDKQIKEQYARTITPTVVQYPGNYERAKTTVKSEIWEKYAEVNMIITAIFALIFFVYAVIDWCILSGFNIIEIIIGVICILIGMIGITLGAISCAPLGFLASAVQNLIGGALFYYLSSEQEIGLMFFGHAQALIVCAALSFLVIVIMCFPKRKYIIMLKEAKELDRKAFLEYDDKKAEADKKNAIAEAKLKAEIAQQIESINEKKALYSDELRACRTAIGENRILSDQDKNSYTVETLINYFDRGRASSIKEAINLFVQEQRLDQMDREARFARMEAQRKQDAAIRKMAEEQEYHNEQMRKIARENSKKIDEAIDDIKNGR